VRRDFEIECLGLGMNNKNYPGALMTDKKTGLAISPKYPCIKGEGLCKIRLTGSGDFQCAFEKGARCRYRVKKEGVDSDDSSSRRVPEVRRVA